MRGGRKGERKREGEEEGRVRDVPPQFQLLDPPVLADTHRNSNVTDKLRLMMIDECLFPVQDIR